MEEIEKTKEEALIRAGFRKRTNHENSDVYKIFSILYGLVVFVGGVAFSISYAIVPKEQAEIIEHLTEIYFTYLYWVSILWIFFCIIDIVHHRNKVKVPTSTLSRLVSHHIGLTRASRLTRDKLMPIQSLVGPESSTPIQDGTPPVDDEEDQSNDSDQTTGFIDHQISHKSSGKRSSLDVARDALSRRGALGLTQEQDLRSYVRHRRNSIVQHAIGYNYDDSSSVGGLYTRVGIGIFCLGTAIHSSLSILSNLESRACTRWTAVVDDFSRLLFSFIQFFFIFKHSNLIIRAHEGIARLAVIHIVITNLCVWFRMVVIETISQIAEVADDEMPVIQYKNITTSYFNNGTKEKINLLQRLLLNPSECSNLLANGPPATSFINDGYMKLKPLLYPCTIEFSLMCLTLFFLIWENIGKTFPHKISDEASTKNVFMVNCHASIKGLFSGMVFFSCTVISIILYVVFRNKMGDVTHASRIGHTPSLTTLTNTTIPAQRQHVIHGSLTLKEIDYSLAFLETVNLCLLVLSLCATLWSLIRIRKLDYRRTTTRFDDVLIIVSLMGIYLYSFFSAFAIIGNLSSSTWLAYVKLAIILLESIEGTVHALFILIALRKRLKRTHHYEYPKTTTTTKHEANPFQLVFYHVVPWSIIAAIATPLQIFFRFHASVCLSHIWTHMYQFPTYETMVSRD